MSAGQPGSDLSAGNRLRQVLGLGEELLSLAQRAVAEDTPAQDMIAGQGRRILETAGRLTAARPSLWLSMDIVRPYTRKGEERSLAFGAAPYSSPQSDAPFSPLMLACLENGRITCGQGQGEEPFWSPQAARAGRSSRSRKPPHAARAAAAPLHLLDSDGAPAQLLGILQIERPEGDPFSPDDLELLEGLAIQAALSIQSSLRIIDERWRMQQLSLVRQVSLQVINLRDLDEIARRITRLIQETFDYYYVALLTTEPGQDLLQFRASAGAGRVETDPPAISGSSDQSGVFDVPGAPNDQAAPEKQAAPKRQAAPVVRVRVGEGLIGHVAKTGQEVLAGDVTVDPFYQHIDILPETRSEFALPLKAQERLLGVLDVQSDKVDDFDDVDQLVLRALAGNIAIAVEDAALYNALSRRAAQMEAVYAVSSAITSILDQDQLLSQVVNLIQQRFGYPYVHVYSVHPGRRKVFYEAGTYGETLRERDFAYELDDLHGLVAWVARSGQTTLVNDVSQDDRYRSSEVAPDETRAELVVPLVFGGETLGVLDVHSERLNAFGEEDRFLFETLAGPVAIALRNATLYRSELWRRQVAEGMREVAGLLSADADLDHVLEAILNELSRTLPLDAAAIWLLDDEGEDLQVSQLHLAAVGGELASPLDLEVGLTPDEVWEFGAPAAQEDSSPVSLDTPPSAWLREALQAQEPITRTAHSPYEPLGAVLAYPADYSGLAVPLRVGSQLLGLLVLVHHTAGRYGSEARAMTAAFASYVAVAIENTRMYEAAHEQAWVSTVLLQVAEATQSLTNLNELLNTVIRITPMLAGVKTALMYIVDEDGDFIPAASSELNDEQKAEFERWRFAPGEVPVLDQLVEEQHPIILHGDPDDQLLTSILFAGSTGRERQSGEVGLSVLVPLAARNELLGALVVDYSAGAAGFTGKSLEAFFDERLAILQGIAHQTAIAVDNIRLIKSQREEAYVSVALLQVAQAVVSSNDLDEALGSIVRITPILVGVKRALVYLWDDPHHVFRLAQAYGVSRLAETRTYALGEFPLLDAVLVEDTLLAFPLGGSHLPTGADDSFNDEDSLPGAWTALQPPEREDVEDYLENAACLLIAFPLSVKSKVLGVFLVEEPDPVGGDGYGSGGANRRLRSKRLEIITGISQQAALAIQNDQLQREMVEQERLEREMQLAREIQNAFLPQVVPDLPGWDMRVRWRTAREVGGDFYDFFELPGGRLGLVIADVADKGMPAALFMTLVRTLMRATVQDVDSPAEVLERVNEIIVPEAPRGMFVTILYGVLDLDTGILEYANAGHNPALLLRTGDCRLEQLTRTGMALGVETGNIMLERKITLQPGDYLVFYTDGVTEAFSPNGEFYGEARLQAVVENAAACHASAAAPLTAEVLLNEIDRSVQDLIGDMDPADDLTLLIVKREPDN